MLSVILASFFSLMGKTFRNCTPAKSSDCIRWGGFSPAILRFNPCGWRENVGLNRPNATDRNHRPDGALKNKARRQDSARAQKKQSLVDLADSETESPQGNDIMMYCRHERHQVINKCCDSQFHSASSLSMQQSQPAQEQKCKFSQLPGDSFEEKLVNGMVSDVSQLCLSEVLKNASFVSSKGRNSIEVHVPLCLDFNMRQLECIEMQLVQSKAGTDEAHTRPWFSSSSASFENALSKALERGIAKLLHVRCTTVRVSSKASLGYARYTAANPCNGRPRLYIWSTGLVPHVSVKISCQMPQNEEESLLCVHRHFAWWQYAVECCREARRLTQEPHKQAAAAASTTTEQFPRLIAAAAAEQKHQRAAAEVVYVKLQAAIHRSTVSRKHALQTQVPWSA